MKQFRKINTLTGWLVFAIASVVYLITAEPTTSFWDCGEYIATAYKLQVGHPPGAPLFQMLGRAFSLLALGDTTAVAYTVNAMSALSSGFTILFLFWSITHLARKIISPNDEFNTAGLITITGSGVVGALAYTFSDSFWFSAVEGEVYALSSFFTAFVFWAMLKWEESAGKPHSVRWIVLIAYMTGLSIGVHLLNLLAIPAISLIFYFRKYKPAPKGIIITLLTSVVLLGLIMNVIIPWIVKLAGLSELLFVNTFRLPFNTGTIFYFLVLGALIVWALHYTRSRGKVVWNTIVLAFTFILIGYSSFFMLIIRSNANTPINENQPDNAINLLSYLNREQYGDWPLLHGPWYNAPVVDREDGSPVYKKDLRSRKYIVVDRRKDYEPVYDPEFTTVFPRMWSNTDAAHAGNYKKWGKIKGTPVTITNRDGEKEVVYKPTFGENLRYFFDYQLNYMYFRYFMWNFAGKQNDNQGFGNDLNGNWISGIRWLDEMRLGPRSDLPESMQSKAHNRYYLLPLLLGLTGLFWHTNRNYRDALIVTLLFIMTGIAIVVYLNQVAYQPRERDYAYAASFYAFSIWIGLGVAAIVQMFRRFAAQKTIAFTVSAACLITVPGIMASENLDDHDRSGRYTARDMARNYLESCAPNAILFTMGDNDTFPLWYAQDVEGIRTDVRVVNLSLLASDWYISQMKRKVYNSPPVPFSLNYEQYKPGTRDVVYLTNDERIQGAVDLKELFGVIHQNPKALQIESTYGTLDYFPVKQFYITADSATVVNNGTVPPGDAPYITDTIVWSINEGAISKSSLMVLDLLAHNDWERPVYFSTTAGESAYLGLTDYFRLEGMAYRLVPVRKPSEDELSGHVNTSILYDRLMHTFSYGNMDDPGVYLDETNRRMIANLRNIFGRLAGELAEEGKNDEAIRVCDKCQELMPDESIRYNFYMLTIAEIYMQAGAPEKGEKLLSRLLDLYTQDMDFYLRFPRHKMQQLDFDMQQALAVINRVSMVASHYKLSELETRSASALERLYNNYLNVTGR